MTKAPAVATSMPADITVIPVILSGGSGSRLWPVSRASLPKQFWAFFSDKTILQETLLRGTKATRFAAPIVVCNQDHRFIIAEQLREIGIEDAHILLEPKGRNSAPAIAAAALVAQKNTPNAVLWVMAADAAISNPDGLTSALAQAVLAATEGHFVTFGVRPDKPETGYGYIRYGAALPGLGGVHRVESFIEKPDLPRAEEMLKSGEHLWNSGMFVFTVDTILKELHAFEPEMTQYVKDAVNHASKDADFYRLGPEDFLKARDISIDYAVAERTQCAAVVPADLGWSDVGSWEALWELGSKDRHNNVRHGEVVINNCQNSYIRTDGPLVAVTGVKDVVVVATQDAVLVADRRHSQNVKQLVQTMMEQGLPQATSHKSCYRPWGHYESLIQGDRFQVKRIVVLPGHQLSLQKHFHRAEHWVVVEGTAIVTCGDNPDAMEEKTVKENESIYLPLGSWHRLSNPGHIPLTLIEVQSGAYLGEDDIVRKEDDYRRL